MRVWRMPEIACVPGHADWIDASFAASGATRPDAYEADRASMAGGTCALAGGEATRAAALGDETPSHGMVTLHSGAIVGVRTR